MMAMIVVIFDYEESDVDECTRRDQTSSDTELIEKIKKENKQHQTIKPAAS